jgi:hypothetical protein
MVVMSARMAYARGRETISNKTEDEDEDEGKAGPSFS